MFCFDLLLSPLTQELLLLLLGNIGNEGGISHCARSFRYVISHSAYFSMSPDSNAKPKSSGIQACPIYFVSFSMHERYT